MADLAKITVGIGEPCPGCGEPYRFDHLSHVIEKFFGKPKPASIPDAMDLLVGDHAREVVPEPRGILDISAELASYAKPKPCERRTVTATLEEIADVASRAQFITPFGDADRTATAAYLRLLIEELERA